jgi:hypothetical protein
MFCEDGVFMPSMDETALFYSKSLTKRRLFRQTGRNVSGAHAGQ